MNIVPLTPRGVEPVSASHLKQSMNVLHDHDDELIETLQATVREFVEEDLRVITTEQTFRGYCSSFSESIYFPVRPIRRIGSLSYFDRNGVFQTLPPDHYQFDGHSRSPSLKPAPGYEWPTTQTDRSSAVWIEFTAGFDAIENVPKPILHAIKLLVGHFYENRESTVQGINVSMLPQGYDFLVQSYRNYSF
ncbi:head-tail connector protein [Pleionea sediminis]|uniref:head-tail connector protein n=1 Tax=Pleionea sediminis TaxID=2569479 RepID=UPI001185760F|nr:phage head-tail connector protein [Pleionea sediminis]